MEINSSVSVRPPKLADTDLNWAFGSNLGRLSEADVHAIVFRHVEIRVATQAHDEWLPLAAAITTMLETAAEWQRQQARPEWAYVREEAAELHQRLRERVENEHVLVRGHIALCEKAIAELSRMCDQETLTAAFRTGAPRDRSVLRHLQGLRAALERAISRWNTDQERLYSDLDALLAELDRRKGFATTFESLTLEHIDQLSPEKFEEIVAWLLYRDGCTILRARGGAHDQGADVIATTQDGRRVVVQCKHSIKPRSRVDPRYVHALNGTARPVHAADVVAIVTNRTLSQAARQFAASQGIHVVDRAVMQRWATYGVAWLPAPEPGATPYADPALAAA
ncbi:restriction endonuclease [Actinoplanes sp. RD1]|uniref:restriction endonuclease n=1 Tax=Actinoplanes sp. RD1 TaxID=3064538 RepID=UPI00274230C2|nr:restriction endonuclease [Actinoplanes sp. RD1]